ncbi:uncharacterized protein LOC125516528 [Triticum urartu]|uniref:uncharacterized protein LOC125516528 n=1 Tax=Triticum urartu TaxID=4572 RepID=UPI0020432AEC|nr:uncharacterized protein LOC125516528 [Triticum urartu]
MPTNWWQKWSFLLRKGRKGFTNKTRPSIQKIYKVLALNFRIPRSDVSALFQLSNMQSLWYAALSPPPATLSRPTASLETGAYPYPDSISASPSSLLVIYPKYCSSIWASFSCGCIFACLFCLSPPPRREALCCSLSLHCRRHSASTRLCPVPDKPVVKTLEMERKLS